MELGKKEEILMRKVKNLIVGCGLSGIVLAERLSSQKHEEVLIIDRLHQELNKDIEFSHKSIDGLSKAVNELKMHINLANIKKKYWYYKFMRWHPMQTKRKKYKQKYKDIKQLYKKIRETKYDF